jgi:hypothetical protein
MKLTDKAVYDAREAYIDLLEEGIERKVLGPPLSSPPSPPPPSAVKNKKENAKESNKDNTGSDKILNKIEELRQKSLELEREQEELLDYVSNL